MKQKGKKISSSEVGRRVVGAKTKSDNNYLFNIFFLGETEEWYKSYTPYASLKRLILLHRLLGVQCNFQNISLFLGSHFNWCRKLECPERTIEVQ